MKNAHLVSFQGLVNCWNFFWDGKTSILPKTATFLALIYLFVPEPTDLIPFLGWLDEPTMLFLAFGWLNYAANKYALQLNAALQPPSPALAQTEVVPTLVDNQAIDTVGVEISDNQAQPLEPNQATEEYYGEYEDEESYGEFSEPVG